MGQFFVFLGGGGWEGGFIHTSYTTYHRSQYNQLWHKPLFILPSKHLLCDYVQVMMSIIKHVLKFCV